jgi:FixJ family two-component response regulator
LEVLKEIQRIEAPPPVVVVTGRGDEQVAVEAMNCRKPDAEKDREKFHHLIAKLFALE